MARVSWVNEMSHSFSLFTHLSPKKERIGKTKWIWRKERDYLSWECVCVFKRKERICVWNQKVNRRKGSLTRPEALFALALFLLNPWQRDIEKRTMSRCICLECVYVCLQVYGEKKEMKYSWKWRDQKEERDGEKRWEKKKRLLSFSQRGYSFHSLSPLSFPQVKHSAVAAKASFTSWVLVSTQC